MGRQNFDPDRIKEYDLRTLAPQIIGRGADKTTPKQLFYNAEIIGHPEHTPSVAIFADGFKNFGPGGESGDAITLAMLVWNCDYKTALGGLADLLGLSPAGGVGTSPSIRRPLSNIVSLIPTTPIVTIQDSPDTTIETAGQIVRGLPCAADDPVGLRFGTEKGYTPETLRARGVKFNRDWVNVGQTVKGDAAWLAAGLVYQNLDEYGQPVSICSRVLKAKKGENSYPQVAGGKPKLGIYGNLDQHAAPVVITAGQKDSDIVYQTYPGRVNAMTMGACGYDLPSWAIEKIAALNPPYVLVMFDNDPPSEQQEAEKRAAALRTVLTCPVLVTPPPAGYKDYSDAVTGGADVGSFWARIVAPVNAQVIELLCGMKRYQWIDKEHGDPAYLAALLIIRHEAIAQGLIDHETPLSVTRVIRLSEVVGQPISKKAAEKGIALAVKFGLWVDSVWPEIGYSIIDTYTLSNFGPNENATRFYMPLPPFAGYRNLAAALENEIPTSVDDWANGEFLEELARYGIRDTRPTVQIDNYDFDGLPHPTEISETLDLLNRLVFLTDPAALLTSPFVWPDGFSLADYPNKQENERPNAVKSLRLAMLRVLNEQNTRRVITADGETVDGWQVSAAALANRLGIAVSSVSAYRRAAGLTTCEQKSRIEIEADQNGSKFDKLTRLLNRYRAGATVWVSGAPSRITDDNREKVLGLVIARPQDSVEIEIQLPSIQYAAPLEEIETIHNERSERHKSRMERAQKKRAAAGDDLSKERNRHTPPQIAPDAPEIAEAGYSKTFVYYHLLKLLPDLLKAAKTSLLIARVLVGYGLMKGDTMPKIDAYKDTDFDLEAAPVMPTASTAKPLPTLTAERREALRQKYSQPTKLGFANYPFLGEADRLPGLRKGA